MRQGWASFVLVSVLMLSLGSWASSPGAKAPALGEQDIKQEAVKMLVAPHAIAIETALLNAIDQLRGLQAQIRTAQNQPTSDFLAQYRVHSQEFKNALRTAGGHVGDLKSHAVKLPSVLRTEEYRKLAPAIADVERLSKQWAKQSSVSAYWRDAAKASADLEQLERRLNNALDKSKSLSLRLDIATVS
ncbi:MAG: hypothetical protein KGQ59_03870 [Bdellovibrionales bacterium]|nr:hypothetical protein [Bdellovibrionales bacterium]